MNTDAKILKKYQIKSSNIEKGLQAMTSIWDLSHRPNCFSIWKSIPNFNILKDKNYIILLDKKINNIQRFLIKAMNKLETETSNW